MRLDEIFGELSEKFNIDGLSADDEGVYRLNADGMEIAVADAEDGVHFVLWAEVGQQPSSCQEQVFRILLQAMFMGQQTKGASFSLHDETVYLQQQEGLEGLDIARFESLLEDFVNTLSDWREAIRSFSSVAPELDKKIQENADDVRSLAAQGFVVV